VLEFLDAFVVAGAAVAVDLREGSEVKFGFYFCGVGGGLASTGFVIFGNLNLEVDGGSG
jgi:hypothetical protein